MLVVLNDNLRLVVMMVMVMKELMMVMMMLMMPTSCWLSSMTT